MRSLLSCFAAVCVFATAIVYADTPDDVSGLSAYQRSIVTKLDPRDRTRANGVRLTRMSLAENSKPLRPQLCNPECPPRVTPAKDGTSGRPTQDHAAVLQTVENKRVELEQLWERPVRLREAMRIMAPHIVGDRELKRNRQVWIKNLPSRGRAVPQGHPNAGLWTEIQSKNYESFRSWAIQQVMVGYFPVCDGHPIAYGAKIDWPIAVARGLCLLDCGDRIGVWAQPGNGCELSDPRTVKAYEAVEVMKKRRDHYLTNRRGVTVELVAPIR